jgi:DNA repair ATPase RecN
MKAIRTREERLDDLKKQRKSIGAKTDAADKKLSKMNPENKNIAQQTETLNSLREQSKMMDSEIMTEEAALSDSKRTLTREFMSLKFGGLLELSEKGMVSMSQRAEDFR